MACRRRSATLHEATAACQWPCDAHAGAATGAGAASSLVGCPAELLMIQQQKDGRPLMLEAQRVVAKYGPTGLYRGLVRCVHHFSLQAGRCLC